MGKPLSVQCLIAVLALGCIIITGAICTILAVTSGDKALTKTKDAMQEGIVKTDTQCETALTSTRTTGQQAIDKSFESATRSIMQRTDEMLRATSQLTTAVVEKNLDYFTKLSLSWYDTIVNDEPNLARTNSFDYILTHRRRLYADTTNGRNPGLTATNLFTASGAMVNVFEEYTTVPNDPITGYHEYMFGTSDGGPRSYMQMGSSKPGGGHNTTHDPVWDGRLPDGRHESPDCRPNEMSPLTGKLCKTSAQAGCRTLRGVLTEGKADSGVCYFDLLPKASDIYALAMTFFPIGQTRWTPVLPIGAFVGIASVTVWGDAANGKLGFNFNGMDVGSLARFLKTIEVGGPGARSRLALWIAQPSWLYSIIPLPLFNDEGIMIAVTHNNASTWHKSGPDSWAQKPRNILQAGDPLIRAAARHMDAVNNTRGTGYAAVAGSVITFAMNSSHAGGGWTEMLPGAASAESRYLGPFPSKIQYINGRYDAEEEFADPLPGYARDGEEFFVAAGFVESEKSGRRPVGYDDGRDGQIKLYLMVLIDREYVLGETDRLQQATLDNITATNLIIAEEVAQGRAAVKEELKRSDQAVQDSLDEDRMILYISVAASALLLIVLSLVMAMKIVKPIRALEADMAAVAVMKLEGVEEQSESALDEVSKMQASFVQMIKNLKEFRSYMPASVLLDDEEEEEEVEEVASEAPSRSGSNPRPSNAQSDMSKVTGSQRPSNSSLARSSRASKMSKQSAAKVVAALGVGVAKKAAAFAVCNVREFVDVFRLNDALDLHKEYLSSMVEWVKKTKGIPDGFNADRFYASFNGAKNTAGARAAAGRCALAMSTAAAEVFKGVSKDGTMQGKISCAAGGGDVMCGNMGIDGMKKYCLVGVGQSFVHVLESHNAKMLTSVLCDLKVKNDVEQGHQMRQMLPVPYKGGVQRTFEIVCEMQAGEDEWMYQLEEAAAADPGRVVSQAVDMFIAGDTAGALEALRTDKHQSPQHVIIIAHIEGTTPA
eukprot:Hpha_TRINITY_DN16268_c2_g9::TRINITY_DN16268_c2_g9_i1::g.11927::m.11927